jgi:hypothetical protein
VNVTCLMYKLKLATLALRQMYCFTDSIKSLASFLLLLNVGGKLPMGFALGFTGATGCAAGCAAGGPPPPGGPCPPLGGPCGCLPPPPGFPCPLGPCWRMFVKLSMCDQLVDALATAGVCICVWVVVVVDIMIRDIFSSSRIGSFQISSSMVNVGWINMISLGLCESSSMVVLNSATWGCTGPTSNSLVSGIYSSQYDATHL